MEPKLATGVEGVTVSYEGLGQLLHKQASTLKSDMSRKPQDVPPPALIGVKGRPIWIVADVLNWLRARTLKEGQKRAPVAAHQDSMVKARAHSKGAPKKQERLEAKRLGITVREFRRRNAVAQLSGLDLDLHAPKKRQGGRIETSGFSDNVIGCREIPPCF